MPRILPVVLIALLVIYCLIEVAQANPTRVRVVPRWLWVVLIIVLPGIGAVAWLLAGRPKADPETAAPSPRARRRSDFLRGL
ncbi:MAG: PLD nuclease N-terminal domain-containing protein [Micropruina sp.]